MTKPYDVEQAEVRDLVSFTKAEIMLISLSLLTLMKQS